MQERHQSKNLKVHAKLSALTHSQEPKSLDLERVVEPSSLIRVKGAKKQDAIALFLGCSAKADLLVVHRPFEPERPDGWCVSYQSQFVIDRQCSEEVMETLSGIS